MISENELIRMIKTLPLSKRKVIVKSKLYASMGIKFPAERRGYGYLSDETVRPAYYSNINLVEQKYNVKINYLFYTHNIDEFGSLGEREGGCYIFLDLELPEREDKQLKLF